MRYLTILLLLLPVFVFGQTETRKLSKTDDGYVVIVETVKTIPVDVDSIMSLYESLTQQIAQETESRDQQLLQSDRRIGELMYELSYIEKLYSDVMKDIDKDFKSDLKTDHEEKTKERDVQQEVSVIARNPRRESGSR